MNGNLNDIFDKINKASTRKDFEKLIKLILFTDFDASIKTAILAQNININVEEYLKTQRKSQAFKTADRLIAYMLANPEADKALGFYTPSLVLDKNVKDFYDFKSPKMRTGTNMSVENGKLVREGKIVDNPDSSFDVENYHPEIEGKELSSRVPVAE